jgi:hypothetical protein
MMTRLPPRLLMLFSLQIVTVAFAATSSEPPKVPQNLPASSAPAIETATKALSEGRLDVAHKEFETIAQSPSALPLARGLAMLGIAEVALARQDFAAANAAWERLATDTALPQLYRDNARRRVAETERLRQGLSPRDPAAYRVQLPVLPAPAAVFHVDPSGKDTANGSEENPFPTLEKARDAVRALKKSHGGALPRGGARIVVGGGSYLIERSLMLTTEDSGSAEAPVVYQAKAGQPPVFRGGVRIAAWKPISEASVWGKLDPSVRGRVLEADLKAMGVTDWGDATAMRRRPELFANGEPQTLARWPNEGFVKTGEVLGQETFKVSSTIEGCKDGKFRYLEDRPSHWLDEPDVHLYGYWFWDWFEEYQKVASIDADARTFTLSPPYSNYGYRKDQRYYAVNVFRELDRPGEWYLDRRTGVVYWLPPEGTEWSKTETVLSVFDQPFVVMDEVEHVTLLGLTLQEGRDDGIHIRGGADCLVAGCTIRQFGGVAFGGVQIHGGKENLVDGNLFLDCYAGVSFSRWGSKRWLESIQRFLQQAGQDPYLSRYPELAGLKTDADVNIVSRNLFIRCESIFLRDGGVEQAALNATTTQSFDLQTVSQDRLVRDDPRLKSLLFEPIPLEEMGPYAHPWQARP